MQNIARGHARIYGDGRRRARHRDKTFATVLDGRMASIGLNAS